MDSYLYVTHYFYFNPIRDLFSKPNQTATVGHVTKTTKVT